NTVREASRVGAHLPPLTRSVEELVGAACRQNPMANQLAVRIAEAARQFRARKPFCAPCRSRRVRTSDDDDLLFNERRTRVVEAPARGRSTEQLRTNQHLHSEPLRSHAG